MLAKNLVRARVAFSLLSTIAFAAGCSEEAGPPPAVQPSATATLTSVAQPQTPTRTSTVSNPETPTPTLTSTLPSSTATPTPTTATAQCADPRPAPSGPAIYIEDVNLTAGATTAAITAKLVSGVDVAGTQNDITLSAALRIKAKANGKPDCAVNAAIDKTGTSFAFRPNGCTGAACTGVRALVLSTENVDAIPSGAALYSCNVDVVAGGELPVTGVILSTPAGQQVSGATGRGGIVCLPGAQPSATPTPTQAPATATTTPTTSSGQVCANPRPAPAGPAIYLEDLNLPKDSTAGTITAKLVAATGVAGTQSDINFPAGVSIKRKANGKPDCTVNPDIDKTGTSFAFRPNACTAETCTGVRALVLSTENVDPIVSGSTLFTCNISVTGPGGELVVSGVILSTPGGQQVSGSSGRGGIVCVEGAQLPTATPTLTSTPTAPAFTATPTNVEATLTPTPAVATATPTLVVSTCPSPRPAPAGPAIYLNDISVAQGATSAVITVKLASGGSMVAGTQNDLALPSGIRIKAKVNGKPDCAVNVAIDKTSTSFSFRPTACQGDACDGVRAIVLSTENLDVIPDGSALYSCNVTVTHGGSIAVIGVILSDPDGNRVAGAAGRDGNVCVEGEVPPTVTPTSTPTSTNTPVPTATDTPTVVMNTPTATPTEFVSTCPAPRPAPTGPAAYVADTILPMGSTAGAITVKLATGGKLIAGAQNDLALPSGMAILAKGNGRPDCSVNPAIDKAGTSFSFLPIACEGSACRGVRAIVISTDNLTAIADGAVLYTCSATVTFGGIVGVSEVFFGDPDGNRVPDGSGRDGSICIEGQLPTPTVTATPTPTDTAAPVPSSTDTPVAGETATPTPTAALEATGTATPTNAPEVTATATASPSPTIAIAGCEQVRQGPAGPAVWIVDSSALPGTETSITVRLATLGQTIVGTQNEIAFPAAATIVALGNGRPDCTVPSELNKGASYFGFTPTGCSGAECTGISAIVVATDNIDPIPDNSILYNCRVAVAANATGTLDITVGEVILSDPNGNRIAEPGSQDGRICTGPAPVVSEATLAGKNEVPAVDSDATGHASVVPTADGISVTLTTSFTAALAAHIHCGPVGVNGGVVFGLYSLADGPIPATLTKQLTSADLMPVGSISTMAEAITAIQSGDCYVNVHTQAHQGGEIRGQLSMSEFHATLTGDGESSPVATDATGTAAVGFTASKIVVTLNTTGLVQPLAAHIHLGPIGVNGPVIFGLYSLADGALPATLTKTLTAADLMPTAGASTFSEATAAIAAGGTYVNVHTQANQGGEIRGQVQ